MSDEQDFPDWRGVFPRDLLVSQLDAGHPYNLAESTAEDVTFGALIELFGLERLKDIKLGYGCAAGSQALRESVGSMCGVSAETVVTAHGVALGLFLLAFELCGPGDEAIIAAPCFPPSRNALVGRGVRLKEVRQTFDENYRLDLNQLSDAMGPRTRLISLANPANPSGVYLSNDVLRQVVALMQERAPQAYLFIDESYREATFSALALESAATLGERVIVGASVSKAYGAPGLRVGWLISGDRELRERIKAAKTNLMVSCSPLNEELASMLIARREDILRPRRDRLARALSVVEEWIASEGHCVDWVRPDAGALCCVRLKESCFCPDAVSRFWSGLPSRELQLSPGSWFGDSERIFRLGFGYLPLDELKNALRSLSRAMDRVR